jgi:ADP-dependent NAD(P)H-hydrate dehydratase / NAD(P)H-hydrate epimerase
VRTTDSRQLFGREQLPLLTARESARLDEAAASSHGVPARVLMENAGRSAALVLQRLHPDGRVVALVGAGNNGGDAIVLLRTLHAWGRDVAWIAAAARSPERALLHSFELAPLPDTEIDEALASAGVIVDGMLGTGATGAPREPAATLIGRANGAGRPVLALDLPSGVDATTGAVPGPAIRADVTVTFGWPKLGLFLQPARPLCGRVLALEIGFPPFSGVAAGQLVTPGWAAAHLPVRAPDAHKGSAGTVAVVAGSPGMAGAAAIAARAAYRAGAGLVRVVSPESNREILQARVPAAVYRATEEGRLDEFLKNVEAVVIGPGLGTTPDAAALLESVLAAAGDARVLLDADALNLIGRDEARLRAIGVRGPTLLTPHPKELTRLTGASLDDVRRDPVGAARALAESSRCAVLLKGQPSLVATAGAPVLVNTTGSSDLATAGMGDQLAGMAGAFLAAGAEPGVAGALGLYFGGRAAALAGLGRSLIPDDVSDALHLAFRRPGRRRPPAGLPFVTFDQPPPA